MSGEVGRRFSQVPVSKFRPDLRPIALLRLSPGDLSKALDLEFEEREDDLDRYQVAVLKTPGGRQFALFRYRRSPSGGTEIWTKSSSTQMRSDLGRALEALGLTLNDVSWTHSEIPNSPTTGERNPEEHRSRSRRPAHREKKK